MHELIFGKDKFDLTGVLACSTSYHVYHSLKFGKISLVKQAIETGTFSQVRAYAFSAAQAFLNDFDIQSNGIILNCGGRSDRKRDDAYGYQAGTLVGSPVPLAPDQRDVAYGYQAGTLVGSPVPLAPNHTIDPDQVDLIRHSQSIISSDT